jgi:Tfp pilus assembly protein PilF
VPCAVFLAAFAVYVHTLNPAFRADDSPETIASCVGLGIQHPPGYPLHTLVGHLFSLLPMATPAWRLNLMAAFFGALASALLAAAAALTCGSAGAAAMAGLLLALSPTFWSQSLAAKGGIYTFHAALLALLLLCLILWDRDLQPRRERAQSSRLRILGSNYFLLAVLLFFVGFGNHWETQALIVPALLSWVLLSARELKLDPRLPQGRGLYSPLFKSVLLGGLGLSLYAFLPLRAALHPAMNWGDPENLKQFLWVLQRQEYLDLEVGFLKSVRAALLGNGSWQDVATNWVFVRDQGLRVFHFLFSVHADLSFPAVLLAAWGAWSLWQARRAKELAFCLVLLGSFLFVVTFYFHLKAEMIWILDVFLIPCYIIQAYLAAQGLAELFKRIPNPDWRKALPLALAILLVPALDHSRSAKVSQRDHYWAWDYGKNFLLSLKKDAIVFAEGDFNTMPVYYLQKIKGERLDITHITSIFISVPWGVEELKQQHPELGVSVLPPPQNNERVGDGALLKEVFSEVINRNAGKRPIQCSLFRDVQSANVPELEKDLSPSGLSMEWRAASKPAQERRRQGLLKALTMRWLPEEQSRYEPSPAFALSNYGTAWMESANYLRLHGQGAQSLPLYREGTEITTDANRAEAYVNWGIALASMNQMEAGMAKFEEALKVKPIFEAYANLAGMNNQLKHYPQAQAWAEKALSLQPTNAQSWNNLAIALYYQGHAAEAVADLNKAAQLNPGDPAIANNLRALSGGH